MKAYIFPGQGAQFTGMGKDVYETSDVARELFERANEILGFDITKIMFEGSAEELKEKEEIEVKEPLVILTAIEKGDNKETLKELVNAIEKTAKDVKAKNIVLYPYAHLSSNLASPKQALEDLLKAEKELNWKPKFSFDQLVSDMVESDLELVTNNS